MKEEVENNSATENEVHGFRFAIKKKNALIRHDGCNIILSPKIIQKWVLLILIGKNREDISNKIINAAVTYRSAFKKGSIKELKEYLEHNQPLKLNKIYRNQ